MKVVVVGCYRKVCRPVAKISRRRVTWMPKVFACIIV